MSYDVGPDGRPINDYPVELPKVKKHRAITTGATSPFSKKQKPNTALAIRRRTQQETQKLLACARRDMGWLEQEKTLRDLSPEEEQQLQEAKRYITQQSDYDRHIATQPFRDARPKRIQRLAAYSNNPEPYEGRTETIPAAQETDSGRLPES